MKLFKHSVYVRRGNRKYTSYNNTQVNPDSVSEWNKRIFEMN